MVVSLLWWWRRQRWEVGACEPQTNQKDPASTSHLSSRGSLCNRFFVSSSCSPSNLHLNQRVPTAISLRKCSLGETVKDTCRLLLSVHLVRAPWLSYTYRSTGRLDLSKRVLPSSFLVSARPACRHAPVRHLQTGTYSLSTLPNQACLRANEKTQ